MNIEKGFFCIEDSDYYEGYYNKNQSWNGWAMPYFDKVNAILIAHDFSSLGYEITYDKYKDCFICKITESDNEISTEIVKKKIIDTIDGEKELYDFDSLGWTWDGYENNNREVEIIAIWSRDFGDFGVNAILYQHNIPVANIADSFEIENNGKSIYLVTKIKNLMYKNFEQYTKLPKVSNCSKILQDVYDGVYSSDSEMCHIDYEGWNDFYNEEYSKDDIDFLKKEVKKYGLEEVLEIDTGEYLVLGYGDLITLFNDDRNFERLELDKADKITNTISQEFRRSKDKSKQKLEQLCQRYGIILNDYLYIEGYTNLIDLYQDYEIQENSMNI